MKTFLSIGSGPGIGFATAARFAREGYQIVLCNRHVAKLQKLADCLGAQGRRVGTRAVDAGDPESVAALIAEVRGELGPIGVLHYNVASIRKATLAEQPRDTFNADLAANIGGALVAVQAVAKQMSQRRSGTILLTGGGYSLKPNPHYLSLSIGKAGIRALSLGLFESLKEQGIHIATVTVQADIKPESEDAKGVAELFWQLHSQPIDQWAAEVNFPGVIGQPIE